MKLPIRDQILWPLLGLLLIAVAANAVFSAWWMSTRNLQALQARQRQIIGVLEQSSFPLSTSVMETLRRLTGDEFVVWNTVERRAVVGTLPAGEPSADELNLISQSISDGRQSQRHAVGGTVYAVRAGRIRGSPAQTLLVLTSVQTLRDASREAVWPPLAIGAATIALSVPLALLFAYVWARRIRSLEQHVQTIAQGEFGLELLTGKINDEMTRLVESINSMSRQLRAMREELIQGERIRLVAQLTAGFGHQLRNGLAGAKLAIQLHESRCPNTSESSLAVARNQLALVEEEVRGLLSLGKADARPPACANLGQIVQAVHDLVALSCEHQGVTLVVNDEQRQYPVMGFVDGLRAACLNLTLNAVEAAGPGGRVWLTLKSDGVQNMLIVEDDGPGPPAEIADSLFDSFVTSKPEGIGLGLTVAATVAKAHHGTLTFSRIAERTRFELTIPSAPRNGIC